MSFLKKIANCAEDIWRKKGTKILKGIAIGGIVTLPIMSGIATYDAIQIVEEEKKKQGREELEPKEILKLTWKCYIPTAVNVVVTGGSVLKFHKDICDENNKYLTAYMLSEAHDRKYRKHTAERVGKEEEEKIYSESIMKENDIRIVNLPAPSEMFWTRDSQTGQEFWSTCQIIYNARDEYNKLMLEQKDDYVSYSNWLTACGGRPFDFSVGWRSDGPLIDPLITSIIDETGRPMLIIGHKYGHEPYTRFDDLL